MTESRRPPFANFGADISEAKSMSEAMKMCGMDFEVEKEKSETQINKIEIPGKFAVVRKDTKMPLGIVGREYTCIQNEETASILQHLIDNELIVLRRGGIMAGGEKCFVLSEMTNKIEVGETELSANILVCWSHNGTHAISSNFIPYLGGDNIYLNFKIPGGPTNSISIKHTKNAMSKVKHARTVLRRAEEFFFSENGASKLFNDLAGMSMSNEQMESLLEELVPPPKTYDPEKDNHRKPASETAKEKMLSIFQERDKFSGTGLGALASVCEYVDYERSSKVKHGANPDDIKMNTVWFGSGSDMKNRALKILLERT